MTTEQEAKSGDPKVYDTAWSLFLSGPVHRAQAGGRIICIQTRWSKADVIGRIKQAQAEDSNVFQFESVEFPALDENDESTFPELWPTEELRKKRSTLLKSAPHFWYGPYQQDPTSSEGALIPISCWRKWEGGKTLPNGEWESISPPCSFVIAVLDTAETENKRSNPTACTIWGLFEPDDPAERKRSEKHLVLLHSYAEKLEFHRLKVKAKEWLKEWKPDCILVEAKSTGPALRSELAEAGIFTEPVRPKPGEDKNVRLASVAGVFHSGIVWYMPTAANMQTITQVADFPSGLLDDLVDTVSYAVRKFRSGGLIKTNTDKEPEPEDPRYIEREYY